MSEDIVTRMVTIPLAVLERAKTALEHRIYTVEDEGLPLAKFRRNAGLAAILEESLANDKAALKEIEASLK